MRAVVFTGAGGNEVVRVEERPDPVLGTNDVLVRVRFAGVNTADTAQRAGAYPAPPGSPPDVPGLEVAGTVEACGEGVLAWKPGDRVFGLVGGGGLADRVAAHERHLVRVPDALDEREAAAVPEAFITAHDAIATQAGLRPGETLLVHGAAGGVGSAAVQLGVATGARVLGTVRFDAAAELVASLGGEALTDEAGPGGQGAGGGRSWVDAVREQTGGGGADVILELVGAPHFPANFKALALKGRIAVIGTGAGDEVTFSLFALMVKRAVIRGSVLRARSLEDKALAVRAFEREVVPLLASGRVRPLVDSVYPAERVTDAFDRMDGPGKLGRVLIELA